MSAPSRSDNPPVSPREWLRSRVTRECRRPECATRGYRAYRRKRSGRLSLSRPYNSTSRYVEHLFRNLSEERPLVEKKFRMLSPDHTQTVITDHTPTVI